MSTQPSLKTIAVMTSGGDAPGMNAAIRAVVRQGISSGLQIKGISNGYKGMIQAEFCDLNAGSVANILQRGGTILKSGRCPDFLKPEARKRAAENLRNSGVEGLVCIGGDGSFRGAQLLHEEHQVPVIGVPGTIDNDLFGTDFTIGYDTAVNTALDAIDRIRDTAASHDRLFIVEVMGRESGFIAIDVGVAGGAEAVFIPESPITPDQAIQQIQKGMARGKMSSILVAAEGQKPGRAYDLAEAIRKRSGFEAKVCILGHIQRGGSPTAADRILASRLGAAAVTSLIQGQTAVMLGLQWQKVVATPLVDTYTQRKPIPKDLIALSHVLAS